MKSTAPLGRRFAMRALIAATGLLAGCTMLAPVPEHTRFYTLAPAGDSGQLGAVAPEGAPTIGIRITSVASHLRRPSIVVRIGEHELGYEQQHRWAVRLDDAVGQLMASGVQRAVGSRINVLVTPALRTAAPEVLIEIDLLACEGRRGTESQALLVADWRVFHGRVEKPAASGRFRVEKPGWDGADFGQLAALLSSALDDLAIAIAGPAQNAAGGGETPPSS